MVQQTLVLFLLLLASVTCWVIEEEKKSKGPPPGPSEDLPQTQLHSALEAHLFRQRLLSAFRQVDPSVSESVLDNFRRYYRNPRV